MELPQTKLIRYVKENCRRDDRIEAALTYGSFTKGEGDQYSDIEFWLFFADDKVAGVNQEQWIGDIAPIYWSVVNEYGTRVAFFKENLVRGEFHFVSTNTMRLVKSWPSVGADQSEQMIILDHTGDLKGYLESGESPIPQSREQVEQLCGQYLNWYLFGINVLRRGDLAQAHMILGIVQGYLIWMARLDENSTKHWQTQSKALEHELQPDSIRAFVETTARCEKSELLAAYEHVWNWSSQQIERLEHRYKFAIPQELKQAISKH